jgi:ABC-2 type transport system permease protein
MSVIAAERIKLASVRSPWWCAGVAAVATAALGATVAVAGQSEGGTPVTVATTQFAYTTGMAVVAVMATLAVTSEYTTGTIRTTFLAVPRRATALLAKAVVVGVLSALVGLVAGFGAWGLSALLLPGVDLGLHGVVEWRQVAGVGVVYLLASVIALAVGVLARHTAGAVSIVLVWSLVAENLLDLIPGMAPDISRWLPFHAAKQFLAGDGTGLDSPWTALAVLAAWAAGMIAVAIAVARRRDA